MLLSDSMEAVDHISRLPEDVVHHVMSYLPGRDAARISAVSKKFKHAWYSFQIVDYDICDWKFNRDPNHCVPIICEAENLSKFINDVHNSLRLRSRDISWHTLRLRAKAWIGDSYRGWLVTEATSRQLVASALEKNVKFIDLSFGYPLCRLPDQLFCAASITVLKLNGCVVNQSDLVIKNNFSLVDISIKRCRGLVSVKGSSDKLLMFKIMDCTGLNQIDIASPKLHGVLIRYCGGLKEIDIKATSLESFTFFGTDASPCAVSIKSCKAIKKLKLNEAQVTNEWISNLLPEFHLLEVLKLQNCVTDRDFCLNNSSVLKVSISCCYRLANVILMAPNLEYLECDNSWKTNLLLNVRNSRHLKTLILFKACITDQWLEFELPLLFPFLEHLKLTDCNQLREPKFSHANLETLELSTCSRLKEAEFHVPKLSSFVYRGRLYSTAIALNAPSPDVELIFDVRRWTMRSDKGIFLLWEHLRRFLANFGHSSKLKLVCPAKLLVFNEEYGKTLGSPLYDLRHLAVSITKCPSESFVRLLDSLLWLAPRLSTLSITTEFATKEKTLKFLYNKDGALKLTDEFCYCRGGFMCWRHHLTEVIMENFDDFEKKSLHEYFSRNSLRLKEIHLASRN